MRRLSPEVQTLYAELVERLTAFEAERTIGSLQGGFQTKTVKGSEYYYFQYYEPGGIRRQLYVGRRDDVADKVVARYDAEKADAEVERASIERLCALLRAGGASTTDAASARVLRALADAQVFRLGAVLVGTHAFSILGDVLGVRWDGRWLRTLDIDISAPAIGVVVPEGLTDVPDALDALQMGFVPVPPLDREAASTSFKVRGQGLRVDMLVPAGRRRQGEIVEVPRFKTSAQALPYLEYVMERPIRAAVVNGGGALVNVPDPARFAFHKLLVSDRRPAAEHAKHDKDLSQAAEVLALLLDERPGDVALAWEALREHEGWEGKARRGLEALRVADRDLAQRVTAHLR